MTLKSRDENISFSPIGLYSNLNIASLSSNYVSKNFGGKFFSKNDAKLIGYIREYIEKSSDLNEKEKNVLLASLLYSADKAANTVGHYDAYIKGKNIPDVFSFELINPYVYLNKEIKISKTTPPSPQHVHW